MRKPDFCLGENKGEDQLRGNREADQRLCFRYSDSAIPPLLKFQASSSFLSLYRPVCVGPGRKPRRPAAQIMSPLITETFHLLRVKKIITGAGPSLHYKELQLFWHVIIRRLQISQDMTI